MATDDHYGTDIWKDFRDGYIPGDNLDIHPSVSLHNEATNDIDPVTHEVLRHRLYSINEEHGQL